MAEEIDVSEAHLIEDSEKRLEVLQEKVDKIEHNMNLQTLKWSTRIEEAAAKTGAMKKEITELQQNFKLTVNSFLLVVEFFKDSATREEFDKIKKAVEEWNPEEYISQTEFKNLVRKMLKDRLE